MGSAILGDSLDSASPCICMHKIIRCLLSEKCTFLIFLFWRSYTKSKIFWICVQYTKVNIPIFGIKCSEVYLKARFRMFILIDFIETGKLYRLYNPHRQALEGPEFTINSSQRFWCRCAHIFRRAGRRTSPDQLC